MNSLLEDSNETKLLALARANYSADLSEVEIRIMQDSVRSGPAKSHPDDHIEVRHVQGTFFRWLLNDPGVIPLMDKDGLQVIAATILGELDLDSSRIPYDLTFQKCIFTGRVHFKWAHTRSISFLESKAQAEFNFQDANIAGDLSFNTGDSPSTGFQSTGLITMYGAQIDGDLDMRAAQLLPGKDAALLINVADMKRVYFEGLNCAGPLSMLDTRIGDTLIATDAKFGSTVTMHGANIGGDLDLVGIKSGGMVSLDHIKIGGSLYLAGASLQEKSTSLSLENVSIGGNVRLMQDSRSCGTVFHASGSVSFAQAVIKQTLSVLNNAKLTRLNCRTAQIGNLIVEQVDLAELDCTGAQIGTFGWAGIVSPKSTKLTLPRASLKNFIDEKESWPSQGNLTVTDFVYTAISLDVPVDLNALRKANGKNGGTSPRDRIEWLKLQSTDDVIGSQPWMQLAQYLQARGNPDGAKQVLYRMERIQATNRSRITRALSWPYDILEENPLRVLIPICILWIFGSVIFWRARRMRAMSPTDKDAYDYFSVNNDQPPNHIPFNAAVYTLENVLPVVKFGQDSAWGPNPQTPPATYNCLAFVRWMLIVLGWVLALILAGAIGERFKS